MLLESAIYPKAAIIRMSFHIAPNDGYWDNFPVTAVGMRDVKIACAPDSCTTLRLMLNERSAGAKFLISAKKPAMFTFLPAPLHRATYSNPQQRRLI